MEEYIGSHGLRVEEEERERTDEAGTWQGARIGRMGSWAWPTAVGVPVPVKGLKPWDTTKTYDHAKYPKSYFQGFQGLGFW